MSTVATSMTVYVKAQVDVVLPTDQSKLTGRSEQEKQMIAHHYSDGVRTDCDEGEKSVIGVATD